MYLSYIYNMYSTYLFIWTRLRIMIQTIILTERIPNYIIDNGILYVKVSPTRHSTLKLKYIYLENFDKNNTFFKCYLSI